MENQHPDFAAEAEHLESVTAGMRQIINELHTDMDERTHRMYNASSLKDQISAYVHAMMRSDHAVKIADIENAIPQPYFGRVDFREDGATAFESFYIGRCKIAKLDIQSVSDILVFDWRDPVATIFYESYEGRASYEVLNRYRYEGDVRLKRQFKIENGTLIDVIDNFVMDKILERQGGALLADPLLLERLRQGAAAKLRDIVTSIQAEQNRIIREPLNQVTVIQGVAGSGKSTVGLHRLSYLLYNEKLDPNRLIIIAPNRVFLDYISDLLPEIDAADVRQMVWDDLAFGVIGKTYPLVADRRLDLILSGQETSAVKLLEDTARLKGSLDFIQVLDRYIERKLQRFCLKLKDISLFGGNLHITRQQQLDILLEEVKAPYAGRVSALSRYLRFRINNYLEVLETRARRGEFAEEQVKICRRESDAFFKKQFKDWNPLDAFTAYQEALSDKPAFKTVKDKNFDLDAIRLHSLTILQNGQIEREDLAPLCYMRLLTQGWSADTFDHIVVDEAQDLNAFELFILKKLSANGSFTIMGDLSQGIHYFRSIGSWDVVLKEVFGDARAVYREILYSYRSAKEIIDVFNRVMPKGHSQAIPVYEIGRKPTAEKVLSPEAGASRAAAMLKSFLDRGAKSVGILTKLEKEAIELHNLLMDTAKQEDLGMPIHLVSGEQTAYQGHVSVLPIALAKGLEFDSVIVWNASSDQFKNTPLDARLLYVALSRAMHDLHIMYQGQLTPLLRSKR